MVTNWSRTRKYLIENSQPNEDAREEYWKSLHEIILRLQASGKNIYLLYPIPELPIDIKTAASPFSIFGSQTMLDLNKSTPSSYFFERNKFILSKLNTLPYGENLHAIEPFKILCKQDYCPAVINETPLYFDDDHLSIEGSKLLIAESVIAKDIKQATASDRPVETAELAPRAAVSTSR